MATLVLTVLGDDRAGLVSSLSDVVAAHGGNWERSRMAELSGKFAGIVQVTVPDGNADALTADLDGLRSQGVLAVTVERAGSGGPPRSQVLTLSLVGTDRPGIVRDISGVLAGLHVSIDDLETATRDAPMAGGTLFEATARLSAPADLPADRLRADLEALADELMVDITLSPD